MLNFKIVIPSKNRLELFKNTCLKFLIDSNLIKNDIYIFVDSKDYEKYKNELNGLYNISDVVINIGSNEGWGLSSTEALLAGTPIINNVTGGLQDQCRFENDNGEWLDFDADFPSNHRGTYKKHGEWVEPVFPSNISLAGSPQTPYIFDDRCDPEDVANSLFKVYSYGKEERDRRGMLGHEWCHSDEAKLTSTAMVESIADAMDEAFEKFVPRERYEVIKVESKPPKKVLHKIYGY